MSRPGFGYRLAPALSGGPWNWSPSTRSQAPAPYALALAFVFSGVTPTGDAYEPRNTDAPDALQYAILNAPAGATVDGAVYWQVYRDLVTNVVLINPKTGEHLAQWNMWQPDAATVTRCAIDSPAEADLPELADVAARTFPLACPPSVTPENIAAFIDENLSAGAVRRLPGRPRPRGAGARATTAESSGYAMLIRGVPDDDDVQRAVTHAPRRRDVEDVRAARRPRRRASPRR